MNADSLGQIVILNGVQRSGKTSIAQVMQGTFPGLWINLGSGSTARFVGSGR